MKSVAPSLKLTLRRWLHSQQLQAVPDKRSATGCRKTWSTVSEQQNTIKGINGLSTKQQLVSTKRFLVYFLGPLLYIITRNTSMSNSDSLRRREASLQRRTTPYPLDTGECEEQTCSWIELRSHQWVISYEEGRRQNGISVIWKMFPRCQSLSVQRPFAALPHWRGIGSGDPDEGRAHKTVVLLEQHKLIHHSPGVRRRSPGCEF